MSDNTIKLLSFLDQFYDEVNETCKTILINSDNTIKLE